MRKNQRISNAMMKALSLTITCIIASVFMSNSLWAQQTVTIGSQNTNTNAILYLVGNGQQGLIIPVVDQPNNIPRAQENEGMIVYSSQSNSLHYYDGTGWRELGQSAGTQALQINGNDISINGNNPIQLSVSPPATGNVLYWNGNAWEATNIILEEIIDASAASVGTSYSLTYLSEGNWTLTPASGTSYSGTGGINVDNGTATISFDAAALPDNAIPITKIESPGTSPSIRLLAVQPDGTLFWGSRSGLTGFDNQVLGTSNSGGNAATITLENSTPVTLQGGSNVTITSDGSNTITFDATGGGGGGAVSTDGSTIAGDGDATPLSVPTDGITSNEIADGTIAIADLSSLGATSAGQVLKWDGSQWVIGVDESAGTANVSGVIEGDGTIGAPIKLIDGSGAGQILQWNGTQWTISTLNDNSISNETITTFQVAGSNLVITEAGTDYTVALADLVTTFSGPGTSGIVPDPGSSTGAFLRDDGTWATPSGGGDMLSSVYDTDADNVVDEAEDAQTLGGIPPVNFVLQTDVFIGSGQAGLVPDPGTETGLFLRDDGTWAAPAGGSFTAGAGIDITGGVISTVFDGDFTSLANIPAGLADGDDDTDDQSLSFDGTNLTLTRDSGSDVVDISSLAGSSLTAGTGIDITGGVISSTIVNTDAQTLSFDGTNLSISGGNDLNISTWDTDVSDDFDGAFSSLTGIPAGLLDGDDNTEYTAGTGINISVTREISSTVTNTDNQNLIIPASSGSSTTGETFSIGISGGTGFNLVEGANIEITTDASNNLVIGTSGGAGEANTGVNLGTGEVIYAGKSGTDLQFKSLTAGSGAVVLTDNATDISIDVDETALTIANSQVTGLGTLAVQDSVLLANISRAGASNGNVLQYNGTTWEPGDGVRWLQASGTPGAGLGLVGDFYLNTTNGDVYEKTGASTWTLISNIAGDRYATTTTGAVDLSSIGSTGTLSVGTGLAYTTGQSFIAAINPTNRLEATVSSYDPGTGSLNYSGGTIFGASTGTLNVNLSGASASAVSNISDLGDAELSSLNDADLFIYNISNSRFENKELTGDGSITNAGVLSVNGVQSGAGTSIISAINNGATTGTINAARLDASLLNTTTAASGDITGDFGSGFNVVRLQGIDIPTATPTDGQILKYNTTAGEWLLAADEGGLTAVTSNATLNGDGTSGNPLAVNAGTGANQIVQLNGSGQLPAVNGSLLTNLTWANITGVPAGLDDGDNQNLTLAGSTLNISGGTGVNLNGFTDTLTIDPSRLRGEGATTGQVLQWNGTDWAAADPASLTLPENLTYSGPLSTSIGLDIRNNGNGIAQRVVNGAGNNQIVLQVESEGNGIVGQFKNDNTSSSEQVLYTHSEGSGSALQAFAFGSGIAAEIKVADNLTTNSNPALDVSTDSDGRGAQINLSKASNSSSALYLNTAGTGNALETGTGTIQLGDLAGTGDRMVVADANGVLSTQTIPATTDDQTAAEVNISAIPGIIGTNVQQGLEEVADTLVALRTDIGGFSTSITNANDLAQEALDTTVVLRTDLNAFDASITAANNLAQEALDTTVVLRTDLNITSSAAQQALDTTVVLRTDLNAFDASITAANNLAQEALDTTVVLRTDLNLAISAAQQALDTTVVLRTDLNAFDASITAANNLAQEALDTTVVLRTDLNITSSAAQQALDTTVVLRTDLNAFDANITAANNLAQEALDTTVVLRTDLNITSSAAQQALDTTVVLRTDLNAASSTAQQALDTTVVLRTDLDALSGSQGNLAALDSLPVELIQNSGATDGQILRWDAIGEQWASANNLTINGSGNIETNVGTFTSSVVSTGFVLDAGSSRFVNIAAAPQTGSFNLTVPEMTANDTIVLKSQLPASGWELAGNTGLDSATNFLGTLDATPLRMATNGVDRMHIAANGNIGIGTNNPFSELVVAGEGEAVGINTSAYADANFATVNITRTRGTEAAPTQVIASDILGSFKYTGYSTGAAFEDGVRLTAFASEDWGTTFGSSFTISTVGDGETGFTDRIVIAGNGTVGINESNPSAAYNLVVNGKLKTAGIDEASDIRWKKNIEPLHDALAKISLLEGVSYEFRAEEFPDMEFGKTKDIGLIAQEVEKVVPELVTTDEEGFKSVNYSHMVALLIEAIKEQQYIIEEQKKEIEMLKAENQDTAAQMKSMEARMEKVEGMMQEMMIMMQKTQASEK